ncbi:hypothetical protein [Chelatococcus reniformis]|uniref:Uncharacterized protein n=1 Tax=Chelatococcus reniformis TaxID=1494448 RepID=A0A916XLK2_9HYPH|nr:hypothetical protein [Chelatococcus reniformis]GGC84075.1 hypothetical protein GCM10010994_47450 [Chelatococcus reniformis]
MSVVSYCRIVAVVAGLGFAAAAHAQVVDETPSAQRPANTVRGLNQRMNEDMQIRQQNQQQQFQFNQQQQQLQQLQNRNLPTVPRTCVGATC